MPVAVRYPIEFPKAITRQNSTHYYIKHFWPGQIMTSLRSCEHSHIGRHTNQTIFGRNHSFRCAVCTWGQEAFQSLNREQGWKLLLGVKRMGQSSECGQWREAWGRQMRELFSAKAALKNDDTENSRNTWLVFSQEVDFNQFIAV